jgi:hypothetical protein
MRGGDFRKVTNRNDLARDIIAGFATATPTLMGVWRCVDSALADVSAVLAELGRVRAELAAVRLDRANLLAAARAVITAHRGGEPDPLFYLKDELAARGQLPTEPGSGL